MSEPGTDEDDAVLTIFNWYDDEPADEDAQWAAALYDDWGEPSPSSCASVADFWDE